MNRQFKSWLQHDVTVLRRGNTPDEDDYGNKVDVYTPLQTIKGKFEYLSGGEDVNGREVATGDQRVIVDGGSDIQPKDRIQIVLAGNTRTFEIDHVNIRYDLKGKEHHRSVFLEEIDGIA